MLCLIVIINIRTIWKRRTANFNVFLKTSYVIGNVIDYIISATLCTENFLSYCIQKYEFILSNLFLRRVVAKIYNAENMYVINPTFLLSSDAKVVNRTGTEFQ